MNYKTLQVAKDALQEKLSELQELITVGREGKTPATIVTEKPFTLAQKSELTKRAKELKPDIVTCASNITKLLP